MKQTNWTSIAWAIASAIIVSAIFWAVSNTDTQHAKEYQACVQYHSPKECKDGTE